MVARHLTKFNPTVSALGPRRCRRAMATCSSAPAGKQWLSDFLLWESDYAKLCFVEKNWPDFGGEDLAAAIADFNGSERRFGRVPAEAA